MSNPTGAGASSAPVCYRHPDRPSYIRCQRCERTICPQCQTQAAVGVQCPECVREGRAGMRAPKPAVVTAFRRGSSVPVVTYSIIALCVVIWGLQMIPGSPVTQWLLYYPPFTGVQPWRMITAMFVHSQGSLFHIAFNMFSLFILGPILERSLGRLRFLALYLISGFGGSVAVLVISPTTPVVGASGAIFGLLGAIFIIQRKLGGNTTQLLVVIGLNLAIGFLPGTNIAWEAHVGGLVAGAAVSLVYLRTRRRDQQRMQALLVAGVAVALIVITVVRFALL